MKSYKLCLVGKGCCCWWWWWCMVVHFGTRIFVFWPDIIYLLTHFCFLCSQLCGSLQDGLELTCCLLMRSGTAYWILVMVINIAQKRLCLVSLESITKAKLSLILLFVYPWSPLHRIQGKSFCRFEFKTSSF